jgi:4-hydroxy-3-polyprenylbenzoate decarboxylase
MSENKPPTRLIVGISGASGVIYGIRLLQTLQQLDTVETHLVISEAGARTISLETDFSLKEVEDLADTVYDNRDLSAVIASGSFKTGGMVVAPCSIKSLSGIANSSNTNLLLRAADVTLKERRPLVLIPRECPLHLGHLRLLVQAAEIGSVILPPMPAFYHHPQSIDDLIQHTLQRCLDILHIDHPEDLAKRWSGI